MIIYHFDYITAPRESQSHVSFFDRDESAIKATDDKYGKYIFSIAFNIPGDIEDSRECQNDVHHGMWNAASFTTQFKIVHIAPDAQRGFEYVRKKAKRAASKSKENAPERNVVSKRLLIAAALIFSLAIVPLSFEYAKENA